MIQLSSLRMMPCNWTSSQQAVFQYGTATLSGTEINGAPIRRLHHRIITNVNGRTEIVISKNVGPLDGASRAFPSNELSLPVLGEYALLLHNSPWNFQDNAELLSWEIGTTHRGVFTSMETVSLHSVNTTFSTVMGTLSTPSVSNRIALELFKRGYSLNDTWSAAIDNGELDNLGFTSAELDQFVDNYGS